MPSTPRVIISSKKPRTLTGSAPSKSVVLVVTRNPRVDRLADAVDGEIVAAFLADGKIVMLA